MSTGCPRFLSLFSSSLSTVFPYLGMVFDVIFIMFDKFVHIVFIIFELFVRHVSSFRHHTVSACLSCLSNMFLILAWFFDVMFHHV